MAPTVIQDLVDMNAHGIDLLTNDDDPALAFTILRKHLLS